MARKNTPTTKKSANDHIRLGFTKENYFIMGAGLLVLIIGYALMAGGKQGGPEFNYDEIYSFRRITLAPILIVLGFAIEVFAIFYRKGKGTAEAESEPGS